MSVRAAQIQHQAPMTTPISEKVPTTRDLSNVSLMDLRL
jgi:hypothetical protein